MKLLLSVPIESISKNPPQVRLADVETVELLDRRGYLTIVVTLNREGKMFLRRTEGIKEWFTTLKVHVRAHSAQCLVRGTNSQILKSIISHWNVFHVNAKQRSMYQS